MEDIREENCEKRTPLEKLTLESDKVEGLDDLSVDDECTLTLKVKVLNIGKHAYTKEELKKEKTRAEFIVVSGKIKSVMDKIDEAETQEELEKAVED